MRYLNVHAADLVTYRRTGEIEWLWQVQVTSRGTVSDLRTVLPYLFAAARPYFDRTSRGAVTVDFRVRDDDPIEYLFEE